MYELNTMFSITSRSTFEEDCQRAREFHAANGAKDVLLCDLVSGTGAGMFIWSARFETLDDAAAFVRTAVNLASLASGPTAEEHAELRSRSTLISRTLVRVLNESGERGGPCMGVTKFSAKKPLVDADDKYGLDLLIANGATGSVTAIGAEGDQLGRYYVAAYGDTFEQVDAAGNATAADERVAASMKSSGLESENRWLFDVS